EQTTDKPGPMRVLETADIRTKWGIGAVAVIGMLLMFVTVSLIAIVHGELRQPDSPAQAEHKVENKVEPAINTTNTSTGISETERERVTQAINLAKQRDSRNRANSSTFLFALNTLAILSEHHDFTLDVFEQLEPLPNSFSSPSAELCDRLGEVAAN